MKAFVHWADKKQEGFLCFSHHWSVDFSKYWVTVSWAQQSYCLGLNYVTGNFIARQMQNLEICPPDDVLAWRETFSFLSLSAGEQHQCYKTTGSFSILWSYLLVLCVCVRVLLCVFLNQDLRQIKNRENFCGSQRIPTFKHWVCGIKTFIVALLARNHTFVWSFTLASITSLLWRRLSVVFFSNSITVDSI